MLDSGCFPWLAFGAFVLAVFLWAGWEGRIRPMLVPRAEIERLAGELMAAHGERAAEMAFVEEDRAWRASQAFEEGKWRRVRREIVRRSARARR